MSLSKHRLGPVLAVIALVAACNSRSPAPRAEAASECDSAAARQVVERLGAGMKRVSLLAPRPLLVESIRKTYTRLVTDSLLAAWVAEPESAPGRRVSSPWPEGIEVQEVEPEEDGCRVTGEIVYVTSAELANGGTAARVPVSLRVVDDGGWRIAAYAAESSSAP